jgi:pimeloyl-ACP methyl ester carboxylesterase
MRQLPTGAPESSEGAQEALLAADGILRRSVEIEGRRVSYLTTTRRGAGPTVLLIHGSGMSARCWINQFRGLASACRVLAVDLPGHGRSDAQPGSGVERYADAMGRLLAALGIGPVLLVGHSLGGAIAIALAHRRPEMVRGLVLLSSCARLLRTDGAWEGLLVWLPGAFRRLLFFSWAQRILFSPGAPARAIGLGMGELCSCRPETIRQDLRAALAMDVTSPARLLGVPTRILCGSRDRVTPPALSEELRALIPRSRLTVVDGAGHMLPLEAPEQVNQAVLELAGSLGPPAGRTPAARVRRRRALVRRALQRTAGVMARLSRALRRRSTAKP